MTMSAVGESARHLGVKRLLATGGLVAVVAGAGCGTSAPTAPSSTSATTATSSTGPLTLNATVAGTIRGDEFLSFPDNLFTACRDTPCQLFKFFEFTGAPRQAEVRLRWTDPTRQLSLYKWDGDADDPVAVPGQRYGGPSEIVAVVSVNGYYDAIAVAFEQVAGGQPGPSDSQSFELSVRQMQP